MTTYRFAIDETGKFNLDGKDRSFVCGVLVSKDEEVLKECYREAFKECGFGKTVPNDISGLLGGEKFHFRDMREDNRKICRKIFLPLADKVFVSTGKPFFIANNQAFWLRAVMSVISKLFTEHKFEKGDILNIEADKRARDYLWLPIGSDMTSSYYHSLIENQIDEFVEPRRTELEIKINVDFFPDTKSFFVTLADLVCGFSKTESFTKIKCPCEDDMIRPIVIKGDENPLWVLQYIFTQILRGKPENDQLISNTIKNEDYAGAWNLFYNFLQYCIDNNFVKILKITAIGFPLISDWKL